MKVNVIEATERASIIDEARTWLKTPFAHRSSVKGGGVDCAQFIRCVFAACGVIPDFESPVYPSQWHLHRNEEWYLEWIEKFAVETLIPRPATVAIWRFGRCYSHAGILVDEENVIHAFEPTGYVAVDPIRMGALSTMPGGERRPVKLFDVWDKRRCSGWRCPMCGGTECYTDECLNQKIHVDEGRALPRRSRRRSA